MSFEKLGIEEGDTFRMQPCMSPVWDTAYAMFRSVRREFRKRSADGEVRRLDLQKQVRNPGDWQVKIEMASRADGTSSSTTSSIRRRRQRHGLPRSEPRRASQWRYQRESVQRAID